MEEKTPFSASVYLSVMFNSTVSRPSESGYFLRIRNLIETLLQTRPISLQICLYQSSSIFNNEAVVNDILASGLQAIFSDADDVYCYKQHWQGPVESVYYAALDLLTQRLDVCAVQVIEVEVEVYEPRQPVGSSLDCLFGAVDVSSMPPLPLTSGLQPTVQRHVPPLDVNGACVLW